MELLERKLTANLAPHKDVSLLDVNEKLRDMAPRLKERKPEDVSRALALVTEYGELMAGETREIKIQGELERLQKLLPEAKIKRISFVVEKTTKEKLLKDLENQDVRVAGNVGDAIRGNDFPAVIEARTLELVELHVSDFELDARNTRNIFEKAESLGLQLCPVETGPCLRVQMNAQSLQETFYVASKMEIHPFSNLHLFELHGRNELDFKWTTMDNNWKDSTALVFCLRV